MLKGDAKQLDNYIDNFKVITKKKLDPDPSPIAHHPSPITPPIKPALAWDPGGWSNRQLGDAFPKIYI